MQGPPIDAPVAPGAPQAGSATPVPAPAPAPGWGTPGVAPPAVARPPALPPAPVILPPSPLPSLQGPYRPPQRRSLADMANEQLRRGQPRDGLAEGMGEAARQDCLRGDGRPGTVNGLLNAPAVIGQALSGTCPK
ncbi:hypothetical protein JJ685_16040 [Ramlibacter monticola]|uniref:Uncharacterized protein n=1 Tax=Ramlibacter monticola TaxID=1926872 RepID=A0A936Z2H4_9BURK|nr:hypothetical protein [Ramlibacter monticola]MBL0392651.1 hypothetical protein [Ramlibacter monticola]